MKTTTRFAAALLTTGLALGTYSAAAASAAEMPGSTPAASSSQTASAPATARDVDTMASCRGISEAGWSIPDGEGSYAGHVYWEDYNGDTDQDNFYINDRPVDAQSSSVLVKNNYTGNSYYKHVYSGDSYCMGVGNIPNGETASIKACGWNNGNVEECTYETIEE